MLLPKIIDSFSHLCSSGLGNCLPLSRQGHSASSLSCLSHPPPSISTFQSISNPQSRLTRMSSNTVDKWLDALRFENYRLQFRPHPIDAEEIRSQIQALEARPVATIAHGDFDTLLHKLDSLKEDLASVEQTIELLSQIRELRGQIREKGFLEYDVDQAGEVIDNLHFRSEKNKMDQRQRQWRHLASLRRVWPEADAARRKGIVQLLGTYSKRRFVCGATNLRIGTVTRIGRWASRMCKKY